MVRVLSLSKFKNRKRRNGEMISGKEYNSMEIEFPVTSENKELASQPDGSQFRRGVGIRP